MWVFVKSHFLSKASFQINNGFGRAELVRVEEMHQLGIIPVDQSAYFLNAECSQMIQEFIHQLLTDTLMLVIGINADGIQGCFFLENTIFSYIEFPHDKLRQRSIFSFCHK